MKRWWLIIVLLLSVGINIGVLATLAVGRWGSSQPPGQEEATRTGEGEHFARRLTDRLKLEGEERELFLEIQTDFFSSATRGARRRARIEHELQRELTAPTPDPQRAEELVDDLSMAARELDRAFAHAIIESRKLLTRRQEKEYLTFIGRLRQRAAGQNPAVRRRNRRRPNAP